MVLAERYRLIHQLARGGMGSVWRAEHVTLSLEVAVKVIDPRIASLELGVPRFLREARALAGLRCPQIVQVSDFGSHGSLVFLVMELLRGRTLGQRLKAEGKLSAAETLRVLDDVCRAMSHAHERGVIHRDLKPENIFLCDASHDHVTKVIDFSGARTVVDVAGGNGELLSRVLHANPALQGVLLDLPNALATAQSRLADLADRVTLVPGDFTRSVPATGDVYLLSRVLHDWDDQQCRTILATCARNMPAHAELLVIERLLPESGDADSLAIPWDIHMLCNTGGRERTESHYRALLAEAGFELVETRALPLDAHVLRARR